MNLSLTHALELCKLCELSYFSRDSIVEHLSAHGGFDRFEFFVGRDTQAFLLQREGELVLAFRGTEKGSIGDWLTDIRISLLPVDTGRVHQGFSEALDAVWTSVFDRCHAWTTDDLKLWVTGHSLGGALATLAVDRFLDRDFPVEGLVTFGQPRAGDEVFGRHFDERFKARMFRFVNNEDVVARVPLVRHGFRHVGQLLYFDMMGRLHREASKLWQWLDWTWSKVRRLIRWIKKDAAEDYHDIEDHSLARYAVLIEKNV